MLFGRRVPQTLSERLRVWLWPRRSWRRSGRYVMIRILRVRASPHAIALGCAAGVFASVTPLLGMQMLLAAFVALVVRASVPAALLATFFGNPLSWPAIWGATYMAGALMLGEAAALEAGDIGDRMEMVWQAGMAQSPEVVAIASALLWPLLKPMLAGSVPIGLVLAVAIYYMIRSMAWSLQDRRRLPKGRAAAALRQDD